MTKRTTAKAFAALAALSSAIGGAAASCKEEALRTVTLELGVENEGSKGFSCTEDRSPVCDAMLECRLQNAGQAALVTCLSSQCRDAGPALAECARIVGCLRADGGASECYDQICGGKAPLVGGSGTSDGGLSEMHLYVDYVGLGGTPGCRVSELGRWCATRKCRVVRRRCVAIAVDRSAASSPEAAARAVAAAYASHRTLDEDAPDEPVVVRLMGIAKSGPCTPDEEQPSDILPIEPLTGCAYSCPTVLTATEGSVVLDFDTFARRCTSSDLQSCVTLLSADAGSP